MKTLVTLLLLALGSPGAPGMGDPYFPNDGNGGIDVLHYNIHDAYAFGSGRLHGWTRIKVRATQDLSRFDLDFMLDTTSVKVDNQSATYRHSGGHELVITPKKPLANGTVFTVVVRYDDVPAHHGTHWLADQHEVVAMNEPHMATWWFPANDQPRDKASYDIHITAPRQDQVIANGLPAGRQVHGSVVTTHWHAPDPMASYLAFFAAGRFTVRHGVDHGRPWYVAVSHELPAYAQRGDLEALRQSPKIVDWLESVLGPYPFVSTGGLVTGLDPGFALENETRPTYPVFPHSDRTLLVHELTHQWFGDSVSVADWRDIWLNEGFAEWMQSYFHETHGGEPAQQWLEQKYARDADRPELWQLRIDNPGQRHIFDPAVYGRGSMAVQALRQRIGDPAFFTLLQTWVSTHRGGNGSIPEFEALASSISGQDLNSFFDAWLNEPVVPAHTAANGL